MLSRPESPQRRQEWITFPVAMAPHCIEAEADIGFSIWKTAEKATASLHKHSKGGTGGPTASGMEKAAVGEAPETGEEKATQVGDIE